MASNVKKIPAICLLETLLHLVAEAYLIDPKQTTQNSQFLTNSPASVWFKYCGTVGKAGGNRKNLNL